MELLYSSVFEHTSPFYFISQHITLGYILILLMVFATFSFSWLRFATAKNLAVAIFPFSPIFNYFFYASSNISILFVLGKFGLGFLWIFFIYVTYLNTRVVLSFLRLASKTKRFASIGLVLYAIGKSNTCFILFIMSSFATILLTYFQGFSQINDSSRILLEYGSGGFTKYFINIILSPYILTYVGLTLLRANKLESKSFIVFSLYIFYQTFTSFAGGSKSFIISFVIILSLLFYKFRFAKKIFSSLIKFRFNNSFLLSLGVFIGTIALFFLTDVFELFAYLLEYQFVSPIECTTVVIKESIDTTRAIGGNYFVQLLEPFHKLDFLGFEISQYKAGNSINLSSIYLPDSEYGGTNPSVFCQSTSEHFSSLLIPIFWSFFSSLFLSSSFFLFSFLRTSTSAYHFEIKEKYYSNFTIALLSFVLYNVGTPQGSWLEWFIQVVYQLFGISLFVIFLGLIVKKR
jgi:hypothetical protein